MTAPDDLPIDDPPRQFPDWMRRLDPRLSAEDTNALFRAFLIRRTVHHRRPHIDTIGNVASNGIGTALRILRIFLIIIMIPFLMAMGGGGILILLFLAAGGLIARMITGEKARFRQTGRFPNWLSEIMLPASPSREHLRDFWMFSFNGSEVLEALYLEQRQRQVRRMGILIAILVSTSAIYFNFPAIKSGATYHPIMLLTTLVAMVPMATLLLAFEAAYHNAILSRLNHTAKRWHRHLDAVRASEEDFACMVSYSVVCLFLALPAIALVFYVIWIMSGLGVALDRGSDSVVRQHLLLMAFLLAIAVIPLFFWGILLFVRRIFHERLEVRYPFLYEAWMSTIALDDPDAYKIMLEKYGESDVERMAQWRRSLSFLFTFLSHL